MNKNILKLKYLFLINSICFLGVGVDHLMDNDYKRSFLPLFLLINNLYYFISEIRNK